MLPIIVALAWPTMLEQLMQTAVQYIDTAMVGTLGTQATAAVGATSTVNWLINSTISCHKHRFSLLYFPGTRCSKNGPGEKSSQPGCPCLINHRYLFYNSHRFLKRHCTEMDAGRSFDPKNGFLLFSDPVSSNAARTMGIILGTVLRAAGDTKHQ